MQPILEAALFVNGYKLLEPKEKIDGYKVFIDPSRGLINAVVFADAHLYKEEYITALKNSLNESLKKSNASYHMMLVLMVDSSKESYFEAKSVASQVMAAYSFAWIYDEATKELIIESTQVEDFYGLKNIITHPEKYAVEVEEKKLTFKEYVDTIISGLKKVPKITTALVLLNIIIFVICTFTGSLLYNKGGLAYDLLVNDGEFYRIISSMFLHVNVTHIFSNMVLLYFLGETVEDKVKKIPFIICYFVSGIVGGITQILIEPSALVVGASGAVFGILGVLFALVIFRRVRKNTMTPGRIMFVIVFSLADGFSDTSIANWAHLGGLVAGLVLGVLFCSFDSIKKKSLKGE